MVSKRRESVNLFLTLFRMEGGESAKRPPASLPQHVLIFSFNPFATLL